MSRRSIENSNIRKITRVGGTSLSITLPVEFLRKLKWKEKQKVVVNLRGKKIIIEDWPSRPASSRAGKS